jgi:uncharacterized membrane protein
MNANSVWHTHAALRALTGHRRMLACVAAGIAIYLVALELKWPASGLIGWNTGVLLYLVLTTRIMLRADEHSIRRRATLVDESRFIILTIAMAAIFASFAGIVVEVIEIRNLKGTEKAIPTILAGATIVLSWIVIHTIFAQHYAHEYFISRESEKELQPEDRAGLRFPGGQPPDYSDFFYFSFVIGVASQTADVAITSRPMRRLNLIHCVLAFFFNTTVLALTINLAASLVAG